jgi:hypothetical protein
MIGRLSGRGDSLRLVVDIYLADGGIVALTEYRLLFSEDGRQWLVGGTSALVALQLSREGPIPTLTPPFADKIEFVRGTAKADDLLAAFLEG